MKAYFIVTKAEGLTETVVATYADVSESYAYAEKQARALPGTRYTVYRSVKTMTVNTLSETNYD